MSEMRMEIRKLADLKPAEYNPRKRLTPDDTEYQELRRSLETLDYSDPIVINSDGTIIKGHQRCYILMDMGRTEVPVVVLDIPDKAKEKALNIALNKITGQWDETKLKEVLISLDLEGYDFSVTGFQRQDLEDLIRLTDIPPEAKDDDFDPDKEAAQIETPESRPGDIWRLGRHRLLCGDATNPADIARLTDGAKLNLIITDPPYNVDYGAKTKFLETYTGHAGSRRNSDIRNDKMSGQAFYAFLLSAFRNMSDAMRPGAAAYVFHAESVGLLFRQAYAEAGLKLAQCLIWEKNAFVLGRSDYQWRHEPILYGWKEGAAHYFINDRTQDTVLLEEPPDFQAMKKQELLAFLDKLFRDNENQTSVLYEKKPTRNVLHPTMKPVPLIGKLMTNSSKPGWTVGDFFAGSGSTLIAAEQLGRTAYLAECDPVNADVIVHRWEDFTGRKAARLDE